LHKFITFNIFSRSFLGFRLGSIYIYTTKAKYAFYGKENTSSGLKAFTCLAPLWKAARNGKPKVRKEIIKVDFDARDGSNLVSLQELIYIYALDRSVVLLYAYVLLRNSSERVPLWCLGCVQWCAGCIFEIYRVSPRTAAVTTSWTPTTWPTGAASNWWRSTACRNRRSVSSFHCPAFSPECLRSAKNSSASI